MSDDLADRMVKLFVTGEPGMAECLKELARFEYPPANLVNLAIMCMNDTVAADVCAVVVQASKNWDDERRGNAYEKMRPLFDIFAVGYLNPALYQYSCAVWVSIGKSNSRDITHVLTELLDGLAHHKDPRCSAYGLCLLSQVVLDVPSINRVAMPIVLEFLKTDVDAVIFQSTRYFMNTAIDEGERNLVYHATHHHLEDHLNSKFACVVSVTLGLMQNLMVDRPKHVAFFKELRPTIEELHVDGIAKVRKTACLKLMKQPSWNIAMAVAIILAIALWLQAGRVPETKVFETTPLH